MKNTFVVASLMVLALISCKKETEETTPAPQTNNGNNNNGEHTVDFKDQNLQGEIIGNSWEFVIGTVDFNDILLFSADHDSICAGTNRPNTDKAVMYMSDIAVGYHKLEAGGEIVLLNTTTGSNINVSTGAYEILEVNTVANTVTGRMDIYWSDETYLNGNFVAEYCF
jgi:hypothetical protein